MVVLVILFVLWGEEEGGGGGGGGGGQDVHSLHQSLLSPKLFGIRGSLSCFLYCKYAAHSSAEQFKKWRVRSWPCLLLVILTTLIFLFFFASFAEGAFSYFLCLANT